MSRNPGTRQGTNGAPERRRATKVVNPFAFSAALFSSPQRRKCSRENQMGGEVSGRPSLTERRSVGTKLQHEIAQLQPFPFVYGDTHARTLPA